MIIKMEREELVKKTVKLAKRLHSEHNYGTEYLDRTIYYGKIKTDANENPILDPFGEPIIEIKVYASAGRWVSPKMMKIALEIEEEFKELNELYRNNDERIGNQWKLATPVESTTEEINRNPRLSASLINGKDFVL